jgi:hypothetical protein
MYTARTMKRWVFTEHDKRLPVWWTWRIDGDDGSIAQVSGGFATYGDTVVDAIRNGYRPCDDYCVLETAQAVVHFGQGKRAVSAAKSTRRLSERRVVPGKNRLKVAAAGKSPARPGR